MSDIDLDFLKFYPLGFIIGGCCSPGLIAGIPAAIFACFPIAVPIAFGIPTLLGFLYGIIGCLYCKKINKEYDEAQKIIATQQAERQKQLAIAKQNRLNQLRVMPISQKAMFSQIDTQGNLQLDGYYLDEEQKILIPSEVNGAKIKKIGNKAFANIKNILEIIISEGIEEIGEETFLNSSIKYVRLPSTLKRIGKMAFYHSQIEAINLQDTQLTGIPFECFAGSKLWSVVLPKTLKAIDKCAFYGIKCLTSVNLASVEVIKDGAFGGTCLRQVVIPRTLKKAGSGSFGSNQLLSVYIEEGVTELPGKMFETVGENFTLHIPSTVTSIGPLVICIRKMVEGADWHGPYGWGTHYIERINNNARIAGKPNSYAALYARQQGYIFISE